MRQTRNLWALVPASQFSEIRAKNPNCQRFSSTNVRVSGSFALSTVPSLYCREPDALSEVPQRLDMQYASIAFWRP